MSDAHEPAPDAAPAEHAEHAEHAHGPQLPVVVDEAGDSPKWLPWLGIGLFCLIALLVAGKRAMPAAGGAEDTAADEPTAAEQAGVEGAQPADGPAAKPAAKPKAE